MGWIHRFFGRSRGEEEGTEGRFTLLYKGATGSTVTVGHLRRDGKQWVFEYDDDFRARHDLRPLEGFPDVTRAYRSGTLFPFFQVRIPDADRRDIREVLQRERIKGRPTKVDLLKLFGRRTAASPDFELIEEEAVASR